MMETIRVNMTPCDEVKTIHASQNDGEAREWGFELHNNGEKIDSSSISDQMVFKSYENGTEEILPTNGSTPTTSPIIADIKYPQGLLTDQDFLYRESPTEEDGLAWIKNIKGNTLVWNQLVKNGNFASTSGWKAANTNYGTISASGNILIYTVASQQAGPYNYRVQQQNDDNLGIPVGHKLYIALDFKPSEANEGSVQLQSSVGALDKAVLSFAGATPNAWSHLSTFFTTVRASQYIALYLKLNNPQTVGATFQFKNFMIVDLTAMFGAGNEPTSVSDFTSLFPLSYYQYDSGSLLNFNGTGIKTTGKNLCTRTTDSNIYNAGNLIPIKKGQTIYWGGVWTYTSSGGKFWPAVYSDPNETNKNNYISYGGSDPSGVVNSYTAQKDGYLGLAYSDGVSSYDVEKMMISFAPFTLDEYEPYTSSTTSLPISAYFPSGMKSAGSVYDELTPTKAITRVGNVTFDGTQTVAGSNFSSTQCRMFIEAPNVKPFNPSTSDEVDNGIISSYLQSASNDATFGGAKGIHRRINGASQICVSLGTDGYASGITTETLFNQYLASHPLTVYYELAEYQETSFTTASLVTENAEIPLSNDDGTLIGKCTEELSAEPGFHDAKIKLADADGECYSNKIQLHVERSPQ